jgi:hypothetical protein
VPPKAASQPRPARRALVLLAVIAAGVAASLTIVERRPEYLCRHWEAAARSADASPARALVAKLDAYGRYGLPALVRLLKSDRPHVVAAARAALLNRLQRAARSESLADEEAAPVIAAELQQLLQLDDETLAPPIVDVTLALLETSGRLGLSGRVEPKVRAEMLATCEAALRRAAPAPVGITLPPETAVVAIPPVVAPTATITSGEAPVTATTAVPPIVRAAPSLKAPPMPKADPVRSAANTTARIPEAAIVDNAVQPASASVPGPALGGNLPANVLRPQAAAGDDVRKLDAWTLFGLVDADPRAAAELLRRGFTQRELQIGKHLVSDDVLERRRYAKLLPSLTGFDVRPWLLRLCDDADAEVRKIAATIMATTNDPALLDRLRTLSFDDPDEQVRETSARAVGRDVQRR